MELHFTINYNTQPGEEVYLSGIGPTEIPMTYIDNGLWSVSIPLNETPSSLSYGYRVTNRNGNTRTEAALHTYSPLPTQTDRVLIHDLWLDYEPSYVFLTHTSKPSKWSSLTLRTRCTHVPAGYHVAFVGETPAAGAWDPEKAVPMHPIGYGLWEANLNLSLLSQGPLSFKYLIIKDNDHSVLEWECGNNRILSLPGTTSVPASRTSKQVVLINTSAYKGSTPGLRFAGVAIPIFSLRSQKGWGIGDFGQLKLMADWAAETGQRVIQVLPVNDTTMHHNWIDSYPYGGISIMALHPLYANIAAMCSSDCPVDLSPYERRRKALNALPTVDYDQVAELKEEVYHLIFKATGKKVLASEAYKTFFAENASWLRPYALFCTLRDKFGTADFTKWGKYATYQPDFLTEFKHLEYHYFLQFHLDKQLKEAHQYINKKGLILKGDIPIGITPQSVEAWTEPELFKMDMQAGAPPDDFSVQGQNWGFPTYDWERMEEDHFAWWKARFTHMALYFDAYRIDHILGFFRIWSIPKDQVQGLLGHFDPALPYTEDEIRAAGLAFNYERMVTPFITDQMVSELFQDKKDYVVDTFLQDGPYYGVYRLKPAFDTQRKIVRFFEELPQSEENNAVKEGLLSLVAEVLFVSDPSRPNLYHPRISAQFTYSYKALGSNEKYIFNRLYDHFFYHRHNDFWRNQAMKKLPVLLSATPMLCCAEDLGMIPSCVPTVMNTLQMLSLEVQRMPKDPSLNFGHPETYPYLSVCTTGSHDTSTLRQWWEEDRNMSARYFADMLHQNTSAPYFCEPWICQQIIEAHIKSPAMLCILPWQDWMSLSGTLRRENPADERINIPAIMPHYWRYRMHMTLEALRKEKSFNKQLKDLITAYR